MKRIVITGISLATSLGTTADSTWNNLVKNKSGIDTVKSFNIKKLNTDKGYEIKQLIKKKDKWLKIIYFLFNDLIKNSIGSKNLQKAALCLGSSFLGIENFSFKNSEYIHKIKNKYKFNNGIYINTNTCASGNFAIYQGVCLLKSGITDIVVCGGIDILSPYLFAGFDSLRSLSRFGVKPFSHNRDGLSLGEGGALLILEDLDHAKARKAKIYCEYSGFGVSCDNAGVTGMDKSGNGIKKCLANAIADSGITASKIDLISSHGTGTVLNDNVEANAIQSVFGSKTNIESFKSYIGHTMGASSALGAGLLALTFKKKLLIKVNNHDSIQYKLNFVKKNTRKKINYGINNAFGFGGINSCLVLKRYK